VGCGVWLAYLEPQPVSQEPVTCPACGVVSPWDALYCASCGKLLVTPPSQAASAEPTTVPEAAGAEYMGFWIRLVAAIVDGVILFVIQTVVLGFLGLAVAVTDEGIGFGLGFFIALAVRWVYNTLFIGFKGTTPGKMLVGAKVVDRNGQQPSVGTAFVREVPGKIVSELTLGFGYVWAALDGRKQGWHDKMAGTYVVRARREG